MFEKGEYISFANCGLPYYIGDVIQNRNSLILQTPEKIKNPFNIDVRNNSEVIGIDSINKNIKMMKHILNLVLAPEAKPIHPPIEGISNNKVFSLRNIKDVDIIKDSLKDRAIKNSVVIGGGYVGIETAENLNHLGIETTVIEAGSNILSPFDLEISVHLEYELISNRINLLLKEKVIKFEDAGTLVNIPLSELRKRVGEILKDKEIWTYCAVGLRGYLSERFLSQNGYNVKNIAGGYLLRWCWSIFRRSR